MPVGNTSAHPVADGPGLLLELDRHAPGPLHEQLERALRDLVRSGRLAPGARMPSSRSLAAGLGISRGVVLEAYSQLIAEGYLSASQGAPTRVARAPRAEPPPAPASVFEPGHRHELDPALPALSMFPRDGWLRSLKAALRDAPFAALGPGDPRGAPQLRDQLMAYLGRVRGAAPEPEHTLVTSGFTQGFALLCRVLAERGVERIALEDPGRPAAWTIAQAAGLGPVAIPVDGDGIVVEALAGSGCEVAVATPAHQYPTGAVLSAERRTALLEWAEARDGLIVEDDHDSELRYDREPVGALQGLAPELVCQVGCFGQRLAPALALGWILSPSWLTGALTFAKGIADGGAPAIAQLALADFIARGELDRHLRRMRLAYRARREALLTVLARELPGTTLSGVAAGVFALAELPGDLDEERVIGAAARAGVGVTGLRAHLHDPSQSVPAGLVLGFGCLPEAGQAQAVALLAGAIRAEAARRDVPSAPIPADHRFTD